MPFIYRTVGEEEPSKMSLRETGSLANCTRCSTCILPDTFPDIQFDDRGVCSLCAAHQPTPPLGEAALRRVRATTRGAAHDCVVPLSGGKDSVYVLYYATRVLGLRAAAVMYDSGFQADMARENAVRACRILNVPLTIRAADPARHRAMLRETLRISELGGSFFNTCMNCEANIRTLAEQLDAHRELCVLRGEDVDRVAAQRQAGEDVLRFGPRFGVVDVEPPVRREARIEREADPAAPQPRATRKVAFENAPATIVPGKRRKSETPEIALAKGPLDEDSSLDMAAQVWSRLIPEEELARQLAIFGDGADKL